MEESRHTYAIIVYITLFILLITVGFALGTIYSNIDKLKHPLIYGIKIVNDNNNKNYECACYYGGAKEFSFNSDGFFIEDEFKISFNNTNYLNQSYLP